MSSKTINEEIRITARMLGILERWSWEHGERYVTYSNAGHSYEIKQMSNLLTNGNHILAKTMYYRDDEMHRLDGPAYIFYGLSAISSLSSPLKEAYYINGKGYNANEFNFFITEMIK